MYQLLFWLNSSKTFFECSTVRQCVCVCGLDGEGSWVFASTAQVVVGMAIIYISDWLQ